MIQDRILDLEDVIKNSLVINLEYLKLPEVPIDERVIKEYVLYGDDDIVSLQESLNTDLLASGNNDMSSYEMWYSVSEAVQNAQEHQYKWKKYDDRENLNEVRIFCQYTPIYDLISVQSKGSVDITTIRDLLEKNKTFRFGKRGRGFYIMTKFCDVVNLNTNDEKTYLNIILIKMKKDATLEEKKYV